MSEPLVYFCLYGAATRPMRGTINSAGYDLYASESLVIPPGKRAVVQTGVCMVIPEGYYGRVAPRSGYAVKNGIDVFAGVVDNDYRDPVGVVLFNSDDTTPFTISIGMKIAQIVFEKYGDFASQQISHEEFQKYKNTTRTGGFGSTGN